MRTLRVAAAAAGLFGSVLLPPAATEAQIAAPGIRGLPNPSAGTFSATRQLVPAASSVQVSGTVTVTVSAAITSNIPITQTISCQVELTTSFLDPAFFNDDVVTVPLTRTSLKSGTCKVSVPYIFEVTTAKEPLTVAAAIFTENSSFTVVYSATRTFALATVPSGATSLSTNLAI